MFSYKRIGDVSEFYFKGKILIKKKTISENDDESILKALKLGYTIGSMDPNSPTFQSTINRMINEVDRTIDLLNSSIKDSNGDK